MRHNRLPRRHYRDPLGARDMMLGVVLLSLSVLASVAWIGFAYYHDCQRGVRTYCLGHDWFEDGKAPYPVYRVDNGELVLPDPK
jgi:hypothetical protein